MQNEVSWNLELSIKNGKYDELIALANEMTRATQANEPNTLYYEWAFDDDGTKCHLYERYEDANAVLVHLGNFQEHFAERFLGMLEIDKWHVYGPAGDKVKGAIGPMGAVFMEVKEGFSR